MKVIKVDESYLDRANDLDVVTTIDVITKEAAEQHDKSKKKMNALTNYEGEPITGQRRPRLPKAVVPKPMTEEYDDHDEDIRVCDWCEEEFPESELINTNHGKICKYCYQAIKSHGEPISVMYNECGDGSCSPKRHTKK